jgi:ABC-type Mn2+/Zn2+ transport system ATPase subunit
LLYEPGKNPKNSCRRQSLKAVFALKEADLGYKGQTVLRNVQCQIERAQTWALVGPNGSGKSTFLKTILGTLKPLRGQIERDASLTLAYVPQSSQINLFLPLTVEEAVALRHRAQNFWGRLPGKCRDQIEQALEQTGLKDIRHKLLRECSGGQRQRAILSAALSQNPQVLLLDEPTKGLDVVAEHDFLELLSGLHQTQNLTLLFVTHSLAIPLNHMQKVMLFNTGMVTAADTQDLIATSILEKIYKIPFLHHEHQGQRWVAPLRAQEKA